MLRATRAWWFLEVSSPNNLLYPVKFAVKKGLINDDDDSMDYGISALVHFAGEPVEKCQLFSQAVPFFMLPDNI